MHRFAPLILLAALPSCASIVLDPQDRVVLTSTPPGLSFTTDYGGYGITPSTLRPPKGVSRIALELRGPDGETQTKTLKQRKSYWALGNFVFGGPIGLAIDLANPGTCVWPNGGAWNVEAM